jgi:hypothetical protein
MGEGEGEEEGAMTEAPGHSWRDVLRWFWDTFGSYITPAVLAILPSGTAVAIYGRDFVTASHSVPGWAILIAVALVGPVALLLVREGRRWRRRTPALVIEYRGPHALHWSMGKRDATDVMQVFGDFTIMNRASSGKAVTPRSVLEVRYLRWGVLPARLRVDGFGVYKPIPPVSVHVDERLDWHIEPAVLKRGTTLVARVCLIDHLGGENWSRWLRWRYMGGN